MHKQMKMNIVVGENALHVAVAELHLAAVAARQQNHRLRCTGAERQLCRVADCLHDVDVCA